MPLIPRFVVKEHILPGKPPLVEVWLGPVFVCSIYAAANSIKIVSAHLKEVIELENVDDVKTVTGEEIRAFSVAFDEKSVVEKLKNILQTLESEME